VGGLDGLEQCDLLRGIAAILRTDLVTLAPFPLARTSAVLPSSRRKRGTFGNRFFIARRER